MEYESFVIQVSIDVFISLFLVIFERGAWKG